MIGQKGARTVLLKSLDRPVAVRVKENKAFSIRRQSVGPVEMRSTRIHATGARCVHVTGVLGEDRELAVRGTWVGEAGGRPLKDAIPAHIAEQEESRIASLNPQGTLSAFKDAFTLKQLQLSVRR